MPAEVCPDPWAGALVPSGGVQHFLHLHEDFSVGLVLDVGRWVSEWLTQQHCPDWQVPFPLVLMRPPTSTPQWAGSGYISHRTQWPITLAPACVLSEGCESVTFILLYLPAHRHLFIFCLKAPSKCRESEARIWDMLKQEASWPRGRPRWKISWRDCTVIFISPRG